VKDDQYSAFDYIMSKAALLTFMQRGKDWEGLVTAMFEELAQYDLEVIRAAIAAHVRSEKFFPTLADIVRRIEGSPEDRAKLAWQMVIRAIQKFGHGANVRFPSPAYHYAIAQMGGWTALCSKLREDELPFREKDFEQFFKIGEHVASWEHAEGKVHVPAYLSGFYERQNKIYALPSKVVDVVTGEVLPNVAELEATHPQGKFPSVFQALVGGMKVP
jgi:hypothetical protein